MMLFFASSETTSAWWAASTSASWRTAAHAKTLAASAKPTPSRSRLTLIQHRSILQHIRQYHETHLRASDVDLLKLFSVSRSVGHRDIHHLNVHVVLGVG